MTNETHHVSTPSEVKDSFTEQDRPMAFNVAEFKKCTDVIQIPYCN